MKLLFFLLLAISAAYAELGIKSYEGYQVLTLEVTNQNQFDVLHSLFIGDEGFDFWTHPKLGKVDIMVSPEQIKTLKEIAATHEMAYSIKIQDVKKMIDVEREENTRGFTGRMNWEAYQRWSVIEPWLESLPLISPYFKVSEIGTTTEGRSIKAVVVSTGGERKPAIFIDALFHAREWITGAVSTWFLNDIATNPNKYAEVLAVADIHMVPMANIDGYEYSHTNNRMWSKTRSNNIGECYGVDPNRNFAYYWNAPLWEEDGESVSHNPCSEIYLGEAPFDQPETEAVRKYVEDQQLAGVEFRAYITMHSYGQMILTPWSHAVNLYPPDFDEMEALGKAAAAQLESHYGTRYLVYQDADSRYPYSGTSNDYMKAIPGIKYTYTFELRDTGANGFLLPANQIIPTSIETSDAITVIIKGMAGVRK